jgi:hypothetical protein
MTKKQLITKAEKAIKYLESVNRGYDHREVYCVNVKRGLDYGDLAGSIEGYSKKLKEAVRAEFTDEYIGGLYQDWLESEANYFIEDFLKDNCCEDENVKKYMPFLNEGSIGLYGRSGGWFGVTSEVADNLEALLTDLDSGMKLQEVYEYHDIDSYFDTIEAIEWVLDEADKYNKGMSWKDELIFRIDEFVEEKKEELQAEKEVNQARSLAEKHGYILAMAV